MARKPRRTSSTKKKDRRNVYLGKRVKDIGKPGLDTLKEAREIANAILNDYKNNRISYRKAISRFNLLILIVDKDKELNEKYSREQIKRLISYIKKKEREVMRMHKNRHTK